MAESVDLKLNVQIPQSEELSADQKFAKYLGDSLASQRDDLEYSDRSEYFKEKYGHYPTCEDWENINVLAPEIEVREYTKKKLQDRFHAIAQNRLNKRDI